jgi:hypothetical protein
MRSTHLALSALGILIVTAAVGCGSDKKDGAFECAQGVIAHGDQTTCVSFAPGSGDAYSCVPAGSAPIRSLRTTSGDCPEGTVPAPGTTADGEPNGSGPHVDDGETADGESSSSGGSSGAPSPPPDVVNGGGTSDGEPPGGGYECQNDGDSTTCVSTECEAGYKKSDCGTCVPNSAPSQCDSGGGCTLTQGYWKNHEEAWPVSSLTLGATTYSKADLLKILRTSPRGDASLILAHQLIAALLNGASGAGQTSIAASINAAQAWLTANSGGKTLPYGIKTDSAAGAQAVSIAAQLDAYNNGKSGVPHCG